jgi:hypothetical protein
MPRGACRSISSTVAFCRSDANFRRAMSRLFSRSVASRSIISPMRWLEGQRGNIRLALLIIEGLGHAGEPESDETLVGVIAEHKISFCWSVVVAATTDVAVLDWDPMSRHRCFFRARRPRISRTLRRAAPAQKVDGLPSGMIRNRSIIQSAGHGSFGETEKPESGRAVLRFGGSEMLADAGGRVDP